MSNPNELIAILDRILNGSRDELEIAQLRQWLKIIGTTLQFVSQDGKFNTNVGQVKRSEIHIGDRIYKFDVEALRELLQPTTPVLDIDWHDASKKALEERLRLTTSPLTSGEGISYRTEQVYVPLRLVEHKRPTRRGQDVPPEQGLLLYEETEIAQRFEYEQFLERVLQQGQSPKSGGKRIAIIGEPGAGKTTLLQQIAQWVIQQGAIAIFVSLADLGQEQKLESYLLGEWLQAAVRRAGQAEATAQVKDAFVAQFQQRRVWLLLDGVDEMQVPLDNCLLAEIEKQICLGGLLSQARIVLSCRLNLWDGRRSNKLLGIFDTYRTLEFSYPQQVVQFVGRWFGALSEGQRVQGSRLCAALKAPGKERILDWVKNPLRLTLLCFNWYLGEGTLPETNAELYEQFVADFYEWRQEQFPTTRKLRRQLNAALGELAREAIDKEETRFRLRHEFVCEFLGEWDEPNSLFRLALQLGWLNQVGVEEGISRKAVYAFFHPTFQEYFAAKQFVTSSDSNISEQALESLITHIYEQQWWEIFLLVSELLKKADILVSRINTQLKMLVANNEKIQRFLSQTNLKAEQVKKSFYTETVGDEKNLSSDRIRASIQAFYCANTLDLNNSLNFNRSSEYASNQASALVNTLNFNFSLDKVFAIAIGIKYKSVPDSDLVINRALTGILALALDLNQKFSLDPVFLDTGIFIRVFNSCFKDFLDNKKLFDDLNPEFKQALETIKQELPNTDNVESKIWWKHQGVSWTEKLRDSMIKYRDIGYDWEFKTDELELLQLYFKGNKLLIKCVDRAYDVTPSIKREVETTLLLPVCSTIKITE